MKKNTYRAKAHNYIIDKLNQRLDDDSVISEEEVVNKDQQKNLFKDELDFFKTRQPVHQHNFDINFESTKDGKKFTNLLFSHIAKIRRLREIRVLTAFTRGRGKQEIKVDIKGDKNWLPAIEAFGEGIYFELNKDTITKYFTENGEKFAELIKGQQQELNKLKDNFFLDIPDSALFILTHSLSHLLIRQLTFNSGYSSSALRERIFVDPDSNYAGIMIYTSELDAEGTMGGLVDQARIDVIDLVLEKITEFRSEFKARPGWEKGSPKRANNVTKYTDEEKKKGKANMPGHVRASMNWNNCKQMYGDKYSLPILDGAKVIVCTSLVKCVAKIFICFE